jgi:hypothetical protein
MVAAQAADLATNLKTIEQVGHEGAGNEAARAAWDEIARADVAQLPQILTALGDANPLAANYLRAAIDAIAERQLREGGKLPMSDLEKFVLTTSNPPRGRRLAFELLAKVDATATDRLTPGFIDDPSLELRRDAVAQLLEGAKVEGPEPVALLRQALAGARDLDQIDEAAKALEELGETVDLNRHFGFVTTWKLVGPFENRGGVGFNAIYPPEEKSETAVQYPGKDGKTVRWIDFTSKDPRGNINLNEALGKDMGCIAYAESTFYSPERRDVDVRVSCICAVKFWLNGKLLGSHEIYHAGSPHDQYIAKAQLQPGRNVLLVKVAQNEQTEGWAQDWEFKLRVCDSIGTAVLSEK